MPFFEADSSPDAGADSLHGSRDDVRGARYQPHLSCFEAVQKFSNFVDSRKFGLKQKT
jgi:hypothetical protein